MDVAVLLTGALTVVLAIVGIAQPWWMLAALACAVLCVTLSRARTAADVHRAAEAQERRLQAAQLAAIDVMTGVEFERYVAAQLRHAGYAVDLTRATGDFGVDLIAARAGRRTAVQCKRQAKPVGAAAVQQVVAGAAMHRCAEVMVVANQQFTRAAHELAAIHGCTLVERAALISLGCAPAAVPEPAPRRQRWPGAEDEPVIRRTT